jgi:hypothetical protein
MLNFAIIRGMDAAPKIAAYAWAVAKIAGIALLASSAYMGLAALGWVPDSKAISKVQQVAGVVFLAAFVATGIASGIPQPEGRVPYGSTGLSKLAQTSRLARNFNNARNVAVFEYKTADGSLHTLVGESQGFTTGGGHAERIIANQLQNMGVQPSQVTRIYSELEPCNNPGGYCMRFVRETFPHAKLTWSFNYLDPVTRDQGRQEWLNAIKWLFGD